MHPIVPKIIAHRSASKRANTYGIEFLAKYLHPKTYRLHPEYRQIGSVTGRMSCCVPNLQGVPRDPKYRACFKPEEGRVLVMADLSQVELCVAADLSGDERMMQELRVGDLHARSAGAMFQKPSEEISTDERNFGKAVNFGKLYGQGATGLMKVARAFGIDIDEEGANDFQDRLAEAWPDFMDWQRRQMRGTSPTIRTLSGRIRRLADDAPGTVRANTPIQGTAADGFKAGIAALWRTRGKYPNSFLVLVVHDEVIVECNAEDAEQVARWIEQCLTQGMREFIKDAPVNVDVLIRVSWAKGGG